MISNNLKQGDRVLALLEEKYPGYHPLVGVAKIAHTTEDERLEFDCHKVLSEFVEPKLKSVEVQQHRPDDSKLHVVFEGAYEELPSNDGAPALAAPDEILPVDELLNGSDDMLTLELDLEATG